MGAVLRGVRRRAEQAPPSRERFIDLLRAISILVGGYANAVSLASERRRGGDVAGWLLSRSGRLLRPTTALVLVAAGGALVARLFGAEPGRVRLVAWCASIPLWFLVAHLVVVVLTPVMYALHRRYGLVVPVVLVGLVALGDLARLLGEPFWATATTSAAGWPSTGWGSPGATAACCHCCATGPSGGCGTRGRGSRWSRSTR